MLLPNTRYELELFSKGLKYIIGIDEVGRGPLAGPMVVCGLVLNKVHLTTINDVVPQKLAFYAQIDDSKLISDKKRRELAKNIEKEAIAYAIYEISNNDIDEIGIAKATQKGFFQVIKDIEKVVQVDHVLTDMFSIKNLPKHVQTNIPKGDHLSITIGAASIVAKVYRDDLMLKFHEKYPEYGFDTHKGYGTKKHIQSIKKFGPCAIHRLSFEPIKSIVSRTNLKS